MGDGRVGHRVRTLAQVSCRCWLLVAGSRDPIADGATGIITREIAQPRGGAGAGVKGEGLSRGDKLHAVCVAVLRAVAVYALDLQRILAQ